MATCVVALVSLIAFVSIKMSNTEFAPLLEVLRAAVRERVRERAREAARRRLILSANCGAVARPAGQTTHPIMVFQAHLVPRRTADCVEQSSSTNIESSLFY